jgi:hypothetical protein
MALPNRVQQLGWFALLTLLAAWAVARWVGWL